MNLSHADAVRLRAALMQADKVVRIYDDVHAELERNGEDWLRIDLVKHGFSESSRSMSYGGWEGYMQGMIFHALEEFARIQRSLP